MPEFEINYRNIDNNNQEILLAVPLGKSYITNSSILKKQNEQKGGTCWYYVLNYLRVRYGKDFPPDSPERKNEVIFSSYRKKYLKLEEDNRSLSQLLTILKICNPQEEKINQVIIKKELEYCIDETPLINKNIALFSEFLSQDKHHIFDDFIYEKIAEQYVILCKETLAQLDIEAEEVYHNYLNDSGYEYDADNLSIFEYSAIYQNIIFHQAIKRYNLKISDWHPATNVENLIEELTKNGPIAISGRFAKNFCTNQTLEFIAENFSKRALYSIDFKKAHEEDINGDMGMGHTILITGVKVKDNNTFVYFLDPNDSSDVSKLYRMPYENLLTGIVDIYANLYPEIDMTVKGPFAVYANESNNSEEENIDESGLKMSKLLITFFSKPLCSSKEKTGKVTLNQHHEQGHGGERENRLVVSGKANL